MKIKLTEFFSVLCLFLITSVFWGSWFTVSRVIDHFDIVALITLVHSFELTFPAPMRILVPITIILMAILLAQNNQKWPVRLTILSFIFLLLTIVYTFIVIIPADRMITKWSAGALPLDWQPIRTKWENDQLYRGVICLLSMCSSIASLLTKKTM